MDDEGVHGWGSSDQGAAVTSMDNHIAKYMDGIVNPENIQTAAEYAADFYGSSMGGDPEDQINSLIRSYMYRHGWDKLLAPKESIGEMSDDDTQVLSWTKNVEELKRRRETALAQGKDTSFIDSLLAKHKKAIDSTMQMKMPASEDAERVTDFTRVDLQNYFDKQPGLMRSRINATERAFNIRDIKVASSGQIVNFEDGAGTKVREGDSGNSSIDALKNEFVNYDYWYEKSDDQRKYDSGKESDKRISVLIQQLGLSQEDAARMWLSAGHKFGPYSRVANRKEEFPAGRFYNVTEASDPSGLWTANKMGLGMKKRYKVYYTDPSVSMLSSKYKTKIFKSSNEDEVWVYFKKKFPDYKVNFVELIGTVEEGRQVNSPRQKRIF